MAFVDKFGVEFGQQWYEVGKVFSATPVMDFKNFFWATVNLRGLMNDHR